MTLQFLEQDIPGLTDRVKRLAPKEREQLVRVAVDLATMERPVDDPRATDALEALHTGSEHPADALSRLIEELDRRADELSAAWDEVRFEEPESERANALRDAYGKAFEQARALAALHAALAGDPTDLAVIGAVLYEANGAIDYEPEAIEALLEAVEDGLADPIKQARRRLGPPV